MLFIYLFHIQKWSFEFKHKILSSNTKYEWTYRIKHSAEIGLLGEIMPIKLINIYR